MVERAFIVGVQRCGTTYLYHLLDCHPQIVMAKPVRPEPKVFLGDSVTGDQDGYDALVFPEDPPAKVRGEKSTSYLDHERALDRIGATFPEARYAVILRDPVERALSHYRFSVDSGLENRPLEEAVIDELEGREPSYDPTISVSPYAYLRRGRYLEQLLRLERHTPRDRISVVIAEELAGDREMISEVYRFLHVDDTVRPSTNGVPMNASTSLVDVLPQVRHRLQTYFKPANVELANYLGHPLDCWQ